MASTLCVLIGYSGADRFYLNHVAIGTLKFIITACLVASFVVPWERLNTGLKESRTGGIALSVVRIVLIVVVVILWWGDCFLLTTGHGSDGKGIPLA